MNKEEFKRTALGKIIKRALAKLRAFDEYINTPGSVRELRRALSEGYPDLWQKPIRGINPEVPMDRTKAKEMLLNTCHVLEKNHVNYRVVFGTLLGLYRDGDIIEYDTDLDVAVSDSGLSGLISAMNELVDQYGFEVIRLGNDIISLLRGSVYIDIYIFKPKRRFRLKKYRILDCHGLWQLRQKDFECSRTVKCGSFDLKTIASPEDFFKTYYGSDWRLPIKGLHANIDNENR